MIDPHFEETKISFILNGKTVIINTSPHRRLLDVLREDFDLTGTKEGCGQGHCGTCTVLVDHDVVRSCLVKVGRVVGKSVLTIEGLGTEIHPHPIQRAFVEAGAVQCGFCTPGMALATKSLLDRNPHPSDDDIKAALKNNLCRCTGYGRILEAVKLAARYLEALKSGDAEKTPVDGVFASKPGIGANLPQLSAYARVTGRERYAADLKMPGMVHGAVVRSGFNHAIIKSVDVGNALKMPGVVAVLTSKDVPGTNRIGPMIADRPVLAEDRVRYEGDAIALVGANTADVARRAAKEVRVCYEEMAELRDPVGSLQNAEICVHASGNTVPARAKRIVRGNVERGFSEADLVVEQAFNTPFNEHCYLEPEAGIAYLEDDAIVVMCPTQDVHRVRSEIAQVLGESVERVRVASTPPGGAFGGRLDASFPALLALLAYKTRLPARLVYTRQESFRVSSKRHPFQMVYKLGLRADGRFTALDARIVADAGAYADHTPAVLTCALIHATGPYYIPNVRLVGEAAYTNNPPTGPMRGFGVPQVTFAIESIIDLASRRLGINPWTIRYLNCLRAGSATSTGQVLRTSVGIRRTMEVARKHYEDLLEGKRKLGQNGVYRRGVGVANCWFGIGKGGISNPSRAVVELTEDGTISVLSGASDVGQGWKTILAQMVCGEFDLHLDDVRVVATDSAMVPSSDSTCGSRQTYFSGNAVLSAARKLKSVLMELGRSYWEGAGELGFRNGLLVDRFDTSRALDMKFLYQLAQKAGVSLRCEGEFDHYELRPLDDLGQGVPFPTYAFATHVAEVDVNALTGEVRVNKVVAVHDVGRAINPLSIRGQVEGGVVMGLGFALTEEFLPCKTRFLRQYKIPRISDFPERGIDVYLVESGEPTGPYGAKGVGEPPLIASAAAIVNAVSDACQTPFSELPLNPKRVLSASEAHP